MSRITFLILFLSATSVLADPPSQAEILFNQTSTALAATQPPPSRNLKYAARDQLRLATEQDQQADFWYRIDAALQTQNHSLAELGDMQPSSDKEIRYAKGLSIGLVRYAYYGYNGVVVCKVESSRPYFGDGGKAYKRHFHIYPHPGMHIEKAVCNDVPNP